MPAIWRAISQRITCGIRKWPTLTKTPPDPAPRSHAGWPANRVNPIRNFLLPVWLRFPPPQLGGGFPHRLHVRVAGRYLPPARIADQKVLLAAPEFLFGHLAQRVSFRALAAEMVMGSWRHWFLFWNKSPKDVSAFAASNLSEIGLNIASLLFAQGALVGGAVRLPGRGRACPTPTADLFSRRLGPAPPPRRS